MLKTEASIPMLSLTSEIEALWEELQAAVIRVMRSGHFILGPEGEAFESEVAEYLDVRYAIGVNSGTDALTIALRALHIGLGDEVITTPFSFVATAEAICSVGATPVFVDIDPNSYNLDPQLLEQSITERTKAVLPVHLFGLAAEMPEICEIANRHNLHIVEDTAQAFGGCRNGKKLGTWGIAGAFSFFPSKNLGAFGDAGLIATDDENLASQTRMLRTHGSRRKYENELVGYNSRLDELQAAILRVKLPHVDRWNDARRRVAGAYDTALSELDWLQLPNASEAAGHVFHQYTVRGLQGERDKVQAALRAAGISTAVYYPTPIHRLPCYSHAAGGEFPEADRAASQVLSLPIGPTMTDEQIGRVVQALKKVRCT